MKAVFEYTEVTVTVEAKNYHGFQDSLALIGALHQDVKMLFPEWGTPKTKMLVGLFCPKCNYEIPPIGYLLEEKSNHKICPKCETVIMDLGEK